MKRVSDVSAHGGAQYLAKNLILGILNVLDDPDIFTGLFALLSRNTQGAKIHRLPKEKPRGDRDR